MEEKESITLLCKSYERKITEVDDGMYFLNWPTPAFLTNNSDYDEARRIVEKLGYLPLAIDQAGAYLSKLSKPLSAFLPLFEAKFKTTLNKKPPLGAW